MGIFDPRTLIGEGYGRRISIGPHGFSILRPELPLLHLAFERKAQTIGLKDSMNIVGELGIRNGSKVLEIGVGSGFMTSVLLWFCGSEGRVVSYEIRKDFAEVARNNITAAGLEEGWSLFIRSGEELDVPVNNFHSGVVDIPEPWTMIDGLGRAIRPGGRIAIYVPTYNQMEHTLSALRNSVFGERGAREIIKRDITTSEKAIRPEFNMLGHTGFLLFCRKVRPAQ